MYKELLFPPQGIAASTPALWDSLLRAFQDRFDSLASFVDGLVARLSGKPRYTNPWLEMMKPIVPARKQPKFNKKRILRTVGFAAVSVVAASAAFAAFHEAAASLCAPEEISSSRIDLPMPPPPAVQRAAFVKAPAFLPVLKADFAIRANLDSFGATLSPQERATMTACVEKALNSPFQKFMAKSKPETANATTAALTGLCVSDYATISHLRDAVDTARASFDAASRQATHKHHVATAREQAVLATRQQVLATANGALQAKLTQVVERIAPVEKAFAVLSASNDRAARLVGSVIGYLKSGMSVTKARNNDAAAFGLLNGALENQVEGTRLWMPREVNIVEAPHTGNVKLTLTQHEVRELANVACAEGSGIRDAIDKSRIDPNGVITAAEAILLRAATGGSFGNTVRAVLAQKNAFEPVSRAGGVDNVKCAGKVETALVNGVIDGSINPAPFGPAVFFLNPDLADHNFGTAVTRVGTVGDPRSGVYHELHMGYRDRDTDIVSLYQTPEQIAVSVAAPPRQPATPHRRKTKTRWASAAVVPAHRL